MKKTIAFSLTCFFLIFSFRAYAQYEIQDDAVIHQEERMVYISWDQRNFDPQPDKFLGIPTNPYWWIIWGFPNPNYHRNDLRPLSVTGPQTQRLALVGTMTLTDKQYKLHSDTLQSSALMEIANQNGFLSDADPLWILYYNTEFQPVLNNDIITILSGLSADVIAELYKENMVDWYVNELGILKERLNALRTTTVDRSSRIIGYYRMLKEYRVLAGRWSNRVSAAKTSLLMAKAAQAVKTQTIPINIWTPSDDISIANQVINSH